MKWTHPCASLLSSACILSQTCAQNASEQWSILDNGINDVVQWDHYSYMVNGQRLIVWSGEFHPWRIPVPELWSDILEKLKSAGFNTIALYELWGWHAPNNETLDFENGAHDFRRLFDEAKRVGMYVLYRPGPYSNAEANGGGFPGWLTTGEYGTLRNNDTRYTDAWERYSGKVAEYVRPYLATNGGNVVMWQLENEYGNQWIDSAERTPNDTAIDYMELLKHAHRDWSIDIPFSSNNPNFWTRSWSGYYAEGEAEGNTDVSGLDHYPSCWSCDLEECAAVNGYPEWYTVFDYYSHFMQFSWNQPSFLPEFQGGSYNPWIGPAEGCRNNTGPKFVNLYYRHNLAQKITAMNIYMAYGGTNWGNIGYPLSGISYDYSAPVQENRLIADKYSELKLFGLFLRVARDYVKVDRVGNSTDYTTNRAVMATELRNPDTHGAFYVTRHNDSTSTELSTFKLHVSTSVGNLTVPQHGAITLDGVQSKVLVTDFAIASSGKKIIYSTAEILTVVDLGDRQVVVLWAPCGEMGEVMMEDVKQWSSANGTSQSSYNASSSVLSFIVESEPLTVKADNGVELIIADRETAYGFWAPTLTNDPLAWENETVLVHGPYLVRDAAINGDCLNVRADWGTDTEMEVWAPKQISKITVNGIYHKAVRTASGSLMCSLQGSETVESVQASIHPLEWRAVDGLPERRGDYDDSHWKEADHMSTPHPNPPETYPVLFADEYGFQAGNTLWRGRFDASKGSSPHGVYLRAIGGAGFGFSAYLNGHFLGSYLGEHSVKTGNLTLDFPEQCINHDGENVLFVLQDRMGKDQREGALDPRGILNATLLAPSGLNFTSWKVQGNAGGNELIDPVRGTWNEGGMHGERLGWHLPGYDDSAWPRAQPDLGFNGSDGFPSSGARFYRANLQLEMPKDHDVSLALVMEPATPRAKLRAQLWVNGYLFGKIIPVFGNQIEFPVFPGVLDYHGNNAISMSVWSMEDGDSAVNVSVKVLGVHTSALDLSFDSEYLRPCWWPRDEYA